MSVFFAGVDSNLGIVRVNIIIYIKNIYFSGGIYTYYVKESMKNTNKNTDKSVYC